jgi:hypothetical protein
MAVDEQSRHALYQQLEQVLGREATSTLMAYLPPVGWADVVTKRDLDFRLEAMEGRLLSELAATTRTVVFSVIGTNVGIAGLALALSRFAT